MVVRVRPVSTPINFVRRRLPQTPHLMASPMAVTLVLLSILAAIFLKGFKEAINIASALLGFISLLARSSLRLRLLSF
jgi:hypothetical protein